MHRAPAPAPTAAAAARAAGAPRPTRRFGWLLGLGLALGSAAAPASVAAQPAADQARTLLARFEAEPSVNQVHQAALDYANLHPEVFESMRTRSRARGALPELRVQMVSDADEDARSVVRFARDAEGRSVADNISATDTKGDALRWLGEVRFRFGDVVFNAQETAVARENRYSARARQQLLQAITQVYFERRRAQIELMNAPPQDPTARALQELKIQQLTAELDAVTGGRFSRMAQGQPASPDDE